MIPLFKVLMSQRAEKAAVDVLRSGYVGQGPKVEEFEKELKKVYQSDTNILTMNSCTSAIDLALHLCDVGPGDAVLCTTQTCTASNSGIVTRGAHPIWRDIDPHTGLIDPKSIEEHFNRSSSPGGPVKAIIAVDWTGARCDYTRLKKFGIPVIEDAAHCLAPLKEPGDYVCHSYQAIKALTSCDGGSLKCPTPEITERARLLRWYGLDRRSGKSFRCAQNIKEIGYKYHMNDLNAAIGLENLPYALAAVESHRKNAEFYHEALKNLKGVILPPKNPDSSWWLYMLLVENRESFQKYMSSRGIDVSPVHARNDKHDAFKSVARNPVPLPGLEFYSQRNVAIPVGWWLTPTNLEYIAEAIISWSRTL